MEMKRNQGLGVVVKSDARLGVDGRAEVHIFNRQG